VRLERDERRRVRNRQRGEDSDRNDETFWNGRGAHPPLGEGETLASRVGDARSPADATVFRTNTLVGVGVSDAERGLRTTHLDSGTAEVRMFRATPDGEQPTVAVTWGSGMVAFGPEHPVARGLGVDPGPGGGLRPGQRVLHHPGDGRRPVAAGAEPVSGGQSA